jgi:NurA-like 5'-3' nuclease
MDGQQGTEKGRKEEEEETKRRRVSGKKERKKRSLKEVMLWRLTQLPIGFVGLQPVSRLDKLPSFPCHIAQDYSVTARESGS